jgi:hypothetical protein
MHGRKFCRCVDLATTLVDADSERNVAAASAISISRTSPAVVETRRHQVWSCGAEIISPGRQRLGIILPKDALAGRVVAPYQPSSDTNNLRLLLAGDSRSNNCDAHSRPLSSVVVRDIAPSLQPG